MYTLLELQAKTFGELKKIGYELNVLPAGDRRCRQSWIDAIAGVYPPLLALLEVSPAGEVQAQKPIMEMVENAPGVEVEPVQTPKFGRIVYPKPAVKPIAHEEARPQLDRVQSADVHNLGSHPTKSDRDSSDAKTEALGSQEGDRVLAVAGNHQTGRGRVLPGQSIKLVNQSQEPIAPVAETSPGVEVDRAQEPIGPVAKTSTAKVSSSKKVKKANSYLDCPSCGVGQLRVKQSIYWETSCTKCGYFAESTLYPFTPADAGYKAGDWVKVRIKPRLATICRGEVVCIEKVCDNYLHFVNPNLNPALVLWARQQLLHPHEVSPCEPPVVKAAETSPGVKTEATVSKSAIGPATKNHIEEESDPNPILTGITFSDRFLARYSPPKPENICFQVEANGQLSLIDFEVQSESEPPDPDDFESLDAFREAIVRWDREPPELAASSDSMRDLSASVQPTEKSPGGGCESEFKIGMLVGRRRDRQHLGKILAIYKSRRGIWRAKIQPLNKSNFAYFDCATLVEQRLLYDYEMGPGGFVRTGKTIFNKARWEHFEVFSRKVRSPKPTNWTAGELSSLSTFKLKQIARDLEIPSIPGTAGKRSLIRAILAEQVISQEKAAAQREQETGRAIVQKRTTPTAGKKNRAAASPLGNQLSLFDVAV